MPPIFDQGFRPTCLAVSTSDAHQVHRKNVERLSIEFLYYNSVKSNGSNDLSGLDFEDVRSALSTKGQPPETDWLYSPVQPPIDQWCPPDSIGECFKGILSPIEPTAEALRCAIQSLNPVVLGIFVRDSLLEYQGDGSLRSDCQGVLRARHAVIAVGYDEDSGNRFCIRNSWGAGWGEAGYAWVHEEYLMANLIKAATVVPN